MKKNVIAFAVSFVLALSSIGSAPVLAEAADQEAVTIESESQQEEAGGDSAGQSGSESDKQSTETVTEEAGESDVNNSEDATGAKAEETSGSSGESSVGEEKSTEDTVENTVGSSSEESEEDSTGGSDGESDGESSEKTDGESSGESSQADSEETNGEAAGAGSEGNTGEAAGAGPEENSGETAGSGSEGNSDGVTEEDTEEITEEAEEETAADSAQSAAEKSTEDDGADAEADDGTDAAGQSDVNGSADGTAADSTAADSNGEISLPASTETVVPGETEGQSSEDLFADYVERMFDAASGSSRKRAKKNASSYLSGNDLVAYSYIASQLPMIAAGERSSTIFEITPEILGLEQTSWTAEELGVSAIIENGAFTQEAVAAVRELSSINAKPIIKALLADYPYELYWYEKTVGTSSISNFGLSGNSESISITGNLLLKFAVADEFSAGEYQVDTSVGQSVQTAVANAKNIVSQYSSVSDLEKLRGYKEEICNLVSYNDDAASGTVSYGNPWQLIWVFDNDSTTNVVCEGYSKAFKYLCDQTDFDGDIACILVTGTMDGGTGAGGHMWNIVNMEDGKNYLVDVTNCDAGSIGYPDDLFLVGTDEKRVSDSSQNGYYFSYTGILYYYYSDTEATFSEEDLELCVHDYGKHVWQDDYTVDKEASCSEEGSESIHCSLCGAVKEGSERAISKTDHTYGGWTTTKEATCTEAGSRKKVCSACGDEVTEEIPATGHQYGGWTTTKEATCTEAGSRKKVCSVCGDEVTEEIPAKGHTLVRTPAVEATYISEGNIEYWTCSECGKLFSDSQGKQEITAEDIVIPKIDHEHQYGSWTTTKEATCTEAGSHTKTCSVCGDEVTEEIPATGHQYGDWTTTKEATCTEAGSRTKTCSACGDKVTEEISAKGHTLVKTAAVDATCTKAGNTEYWTCSECGKLFSDSEGQQEIAEEDTVISAKGHQYGSWTTTQEATCTEAGSRTKTCSACGDKVTEEISAKGHTLVKTAAVDATCTKAGNTEYWTCSECGKLFSDSEGQQEIAEEDTVIPAKGHQWEDHYTVDQAATYTAQGSESIHCSVCGAKKEGSQRSIAKLAKPVSSLSISGISSKKYTGKARTQAVVVKDGSKTLKNGTDYTVSYKNNTNVGTATLTITGKGSYTGSVSRTFAITRADQNITVKVSAGTINVGKTSKVTASGAKETSSYKFSSSNTAVATVSAGGVVTGKAAGTVTITVSTAQTKNYKAGKKTVKITVNKVLKKPGNCHFVKWNNAKYSSCRIGWNKVVGADGYQTLLSWTNGTHASSTIVKSNVLYRDCKVSDNHVWQMKVRAFYKVGNTRKYGPWSNVEYITPSPKTLTKKNVSTSKVLKVKINWNIIYGCNGYNVFITTNPNGKWYWNQSTSVNATATSAVISKYRGSPLKKNTKYYVRIVTRRKRNGVFCTVPMPASNTNLGYFIIK